MFMGIFQNLIMVLAIAVPVVVFCINMSIPPIIGYLSVGVLVGPHAMGLVSDVEIIKHLAEFGVVFLMFTIGLEFSLSKMIRMKSRVFGLGSAQVITTLVVTTLIGELLGMTLTQAIIISCIVAMSSTAIVSKQLADQSQLGTNAGQNAISILLFQDLAVIPFFILIGSFSTATSDVFIPLLLAIGKTMIALTIIFTVGRWLLRPLFREIASANSMELFTLSVLFVTLGASFLTEHLDLTLALGAFAAGMMLGETEFRHQIEATIRPFRDVLLGIFFITIGALFNFSLFLSVWPWIMLLFFGLTFGKIFIISLLCHISRRPLHESMRTGLILGQGSEFGFALLSLAMHDKLLPPDYQQVVLGGLLLSMFAAPFFVRYNTQIVNSLLPRKLEAKVAPSEGELALFTKELKGHVILCGFSRVGQQLAKVLDEESISYIGIDSDHSLVLNTQSAGLPVIYGSADNYEILAACKVQKAKAIVITFENFYTSSKILEQVRSQLKDVPIFVRTEDDTNFEALTASGATEVIPSSLESSIALATHLLISLNIPTKSITTRMNKIRKTRYRLLRDVIPGEDFN